MSFACYSADICYVLCPAGIPIGHSEHAKHDLEQGLLRNLQPSIFNAKPFYYRWQEKLLCLFGESLLWELFPMLFTFIQVMILPSLFYKGSLALGDGPSVFPMYPNPLKPQDSQGDIKNL